MSALYLILMIGTVLFPIVLSFDHKVRYFSNWKWVLIAALVVLVPYVIWDELFTAYGIWGFNDEFLVDIFIGHLPLEEVLFFVVVPFACTFIYECARYYFRKYNLKVLNTGILIALLLYHVVIMIAGFGKMYSTIAVIIGLIAIGIYVKNARRYRFLLPAFLLSLLPFLIVNGLLTGSTLEQPIVWYNSAHFTQLRLVSIPLDDVIYAWGLIAFNIYLFERIKPGTPSESF